MTAEQGPALEQALQEAIASGVAVADFPQEKGVLRYRRAPEAGLLMTLSFVRPGGTEQVAVKYFAPSEAPAPGHPEGAPFLAGRVMQFAPAPNVPGGSCIWEVDSADEADEVERHVAEATLADGWAEAEQVVPVELPGGTRLRAFERAAMRRMLMRTAGAVMMTDAPAGAGGSPFG